MASAALQQRIAEAQRAAQGNSSPVTKPQGSPAGGADGVSVGPSGDSGAFSQQPDPADWSGGQQPPPMQNVQHGGAMPPQYMPQGGMSPGMTAPAGQPPGPSGMAFGAPPGQAPGGGQQQPQGYAPMQGQMAGTVPMGAGGSPEGGHMQMVSAPYPMGDASGSQQGGAPPPQAQLMYPTPGGYIAMQPMPGGMQPGGMMVPHGMMPMGGQPGGGPGMPPGGVQFVMVQQGPGGQPQMMGGQQMPQGGMPGQMPAGMPVAMNAEGNMVMMHGGVPHGMTSPGDGKGIGSGGQGGPSEMQDGKGGSRVAAGLGRNSQPKQGTNWHGNRGGQPRPQDFAGQQGFHQQMDPHSMMQLGQMGDAGMAGMGTMPGQHMGLINPQMFPGQSPPKSGPPMPSPPNGGAAPSSPSNNRKLGTKMRQPENPWADMQDSHHDPAADLAHWIGASATEHAYNKPTSMAADRHDMRLPRGKSGRKEGKGGMDDGKGPIRGPPQDMHGQQPSWVPKNEVRQMDAKAQGKGQPRQQEWAPKATPAPKAPMPEPHLAISQASGKGGRGGGSPSGGAAASAGGISPGSAGGGKKSKSGRRDAKMEDWLSARFAGHTPSPAADDAAHGGDSQADMWGDKSYEGGDDDLDYYDGDGDAESRRKRKGGKGGKGKADDKRRDKGKGKGKSGRGGGGFWRSTQG